MNEKEKIPVRAVVIYCILFYSVWTVVEVFVKPYIDTQILNPYLSAIIKTGIIKNAVWIFPAYLLLKHYSSYAQVRVEELFSTPVKIVRYIPVYALLAVWVIVGAVGQRGGISILDTFGGVDIIVVLFVGITEEMVFRGWLLNVTLTSKNKWIAVILNALLFMLIHFPRWIYDGVLISMFTSFGFVGVVILSIIFSLTFIRSRNLLIPITLHMFYDLLVFMLIG